MKKNNSGFMGALHEMFFWIVAEMKKIGTNPAIILVLVGGNFIYGFVYNYMYQTNVVENAPVVVVDNSRTELSRKFIRMLDATPDVNIVTDGIDYYQAKEMMKERKAIGIVFIPEQFDRKINRGDEAIVIMYETTSVFLYYLAIHKACAFALMSLNSELTPGQLVFLPYNDAGVIIRNQSSVKVVGTALYNYTEGYGTYLIPAVLMVILAQTLAMMIGMISGGEVHSGSIRNYADAASGFWHVARLVFSKAFVYLILYSVFAFFLLGFIPLIYDLPNLGKGIYIIQIIIPFILAISFMIMALSVFFTDQDAPVVMIAFFSVCLIFLSGVSYPLELMPWYWRAAHYVFPAAPATLAFVKINSMGADINQVDLEYTTLWVQCLVYFPLACMAYRYNIKKACTGILKNA